MLNFRRFALRNNSRRRAAQVLPRAAEVFESRVLLSGAPAAEVVEETPEAEVPIAEPAPTSDPVLADEDPGEIPFEGPGEVPSDDPGEIPVGGPGEIPGESPGEEPGGDFPADEVLIAGFVSLNSTALAGGTIQITGQLTVSGHSVTFTFPGINGDLEEHTVTADADGRFSFSYFLPPDGIITATAFDGDGNEGDTQIVFV
ncbi:MAG: hypothetical protein O2820_14415 [Planctomycetota bacterium]|nr:hypothetical protein [Planctomycetota bacterium]MDA1250407.1 hypothetical protein [Planctomycetota bacterium]